MAQRYTDTTKWDDDWFLGLPPLFKCVWEYLRDNCDGGTGLMKISFRKIGSLVGGDVNKEDFNSYLGSRIHWVNHESIWIPSFLKYQFKKLVSTNKVHVNMAKKVVQALSGQTLSDKAQLYYDDLILIIKASEEGQERVDRPSADGQPTLIVYSIKDKVLIKERESERENSADKLIELWNENCAPLPRIVKVTDKRRAHAKAQLKAYQDFEHWLSVLNRWKESDFVKNEWKPTFDDWLNENVRIKTLEGKYDNRVKPPPKAPGRRFYD